MKEFLSPEIRVTVLSPSNSVMDDITLSTEQKFEGEEKIVTDQTEEAVW